MNRYLIALVVLSSMVFSCEQKLENKPLAPNVDWTKRVAALNSLDTVVTGTTYLSVYSEIYNFTESTTRTLTSTISMRNTNRKDSIYIIRADYFNTKGKLVRTYFDSPIFIAPMETVEIVIDQTDKEGGTGGNFMFDWRIKQGTNDPIFEAVMISISGQHGLSFTTQGKKVY